MADFSAATTLPQPATAASPSEDPSHDFAAIMLSSGAAAGPFEHVGASFTGAVIVLSNGCPEDGP
jgi:hypothetical protein